MFTEPMKYDIKTETFTPYVPEEIKKQYKTVFIAHHKGEQYKYVVIHLGTGFSMRRFITYKEAKAFALLIENNPTNKTDKNEIAQHYIDVLKANNLWFSKAYYEEQNA